MSRRTIDELVERLELTPHPEGGYYRETYRSADTLAAGALPARFDGDRACSTAIYFLLTRESFSAFHRIRQDEVWHFYGGDTLTVHAIDGGGRLTMHKLGMNLAKGERPQVVVPAGSWFASEVTPPGAYALAGCTVAPGFDFDDFEMADREALIKAIPGQEALIRRLTRG